MGDQTLTEASHLGAEHLSYGSLSGLSGTRAITLKSLHDTLMWKFQALQLRTKITFKPEHSPVDGLRQLVTQYQEFLSTRRLFAQTGLQKIKELSQRE